ncbi:MAG TPA: EAL domain-containing protein [Rhodocyclaceae bacterium]|nr:EAL domain-containing protein [Rhodocyclaceae bacterium]
MRILLLVLAASLLPVLAMLWLLLQNRATTGALAHEQLQVRAEVIARELDDKIAGTVQLLFGLARVPLVGGSDRGACSAFLADVLREHPQYTGLISIKPDGSLFCDSLQSGRTLNLADRNYFKRALVSQEAVVEAAIGRLSHKGVLQVAYPVRDSKGSLSYILLASLNMDAYGRAIAMTLPYPNMNFQVWNDDGSLIMNHQGQSVGQVVPNQAQRDFMLNSKSSGMQVLGEGQEARFWVRALLPRWNETGLRLALSVSVDEFNEQLDGQFRHALFSLLILAVLIFIVAAGLGEFALRRQTARLMQAISRMDAGDYHHPIGMPYPRGELGLVMQALDRMGSSLAQQQQEIERKTDALERQARIDSLTNLANRYMLSDRLHQALVYARRAHRVVGVLMLDLDRFKTVNDSLGHSQGDLLLQIVAERLTSCVRDGDTVARLGGDEFVVVLADISDAADIVPVAQKILATLALPVELGPQILRVKTSLGVAVYPRDAENADTLLRYADTAMYRAKDQGGNAVSFYTPEMMQAMLDRLELEAGLRRALEQGELCLYYQPIIHANTGRVVSAEALLRWNDPQRGLVSPMQFIPIAEETGLIVPIGDWVMRVACTQARAWQKEGYGDIPIAVNLSARQFSVPSFVSSVAMALQASDCPAPLLQLEITESMIMEQVDQALVTMHRLTALGVKLAIDDFGTGYSSLSQLKRFPVSKLKIDRAFIRDIQIDANDDVLVDAIITLARKLGLSTVAEGVETEAQVAFLKSKGCDEYQGYLFAKPCEAAEFLRVVQARNT